MAQLSMGLPCYSQSGVYPYDHSPRCEAHTSIVIEQVEIPREGDFGTFPPVTYLHSIHMDKPAYTNEGTAPFLFSGLLSALEGSMLPLCEETPNQPSLALFD